MVVPARTAVEPLAEEEDAFADALDGEPADGDDPAGEPPIEELEHARVRVARCAEPPPAPVAEVAEAPSEAPLPVPPPEAKVEAAEVASAIPAPEPPPPAPEPEPAPAKPAPAPWATARALCPTRYHDGSAWGGGPAPRNAPRAWGCAEPHGALCAPPRPLASRSANP